jgi:hypothetical protein
MGNANLPLRWELVNSNNMTMTVVSGSASIDGGYGGFSSEHAQSYVTKSVSGGASVELVAFRLKSTAVPYASAYLTKLLGRVGDSGAVTQWYLVMNPVATSAGAWSSLADDSVLEYNTTRTVNAGNTSGTMIGSGCVSYDNVLPVYDLGETKINVLGMLGAYANGVSDVLSIQAYNNDTGAAHTYTFWPYLREFA